MANRSRLAKKPFTWHPGNVSSQNIPSMMMRSYWEHDTLAHIVEGLFLNAGENLAEVGAGYGRMAMVLDSIFPGSVTAFEREADMVNAGSRILPNVDWRRVKFLSKLPAPDKAFDFVMTFTVLQHLTDSEAVATLSEIDRITSRFVLLVEETDETYHRGSVEKNHLTHGRRMEWYREQISGFDLIDKWARPNEPGYTYKKQPKPFSGEYMLFERRA